DAHHDATALLGDLERNVARPRLHGRNSRSLSSCGTSCRSRLHRGTPVPDHCTVGTSSAELHRTVLTKIIVARRGQKETAAASPPRPGQFQEVGCPNSRPLRPTATE